MINFASFPVTLAGQQFTYLTEGMAVLEGLDFYEAAVVADLHEEWRETLAELEAAFAGIPGRVLADTSLALAESHPLDFETREALLIVLSAAPEEYQDAVERLKEIDEVLADPGELRALAWERQVAAVKEMRADGMPIELRPDTSPEMRGLLKIGGELEREQIRELMFNRTAEGKPIAGKYYPDRRSHAEPTAYFGMVFSAGKSVSVRAAFADRAERLVIISAHERAVDKTLRDLELDIGWVRRGHGGSSRERGEMTWVRFRHEISRKGDPHLHTHVVVPNVVRSLESEGVGSLDTRRAQGRINAVHRVTYHQELARNLREAGINATYRNEGGVPEAVIDGIGLRMQKALSQRSEDGLAKAAELVGGDLSMLSDYARKRVVVGATKYLRPEKGEYSGDRATWEKRLEQHAPEELQAELRSGRMTSGAAQAYIVQRSEKEKPLDKPRPRRQMQAREMDVGGGGGDPSYRFHKEQEREQ